MRGPFATFTVRLLAQRRSPRDPEESPRVKTSRQAGQPPSSTMEGPEWCDSALQAEGPRIRTCLNYSRKLWGAYLYFPITVPVSSCPGIATPNKVTGGSEFRAPGPRSEHSIQHGLEKRKRNCGRRALPPLTSIRQLPGVPEEPIYSSGPEMLQPGPLIYAPGRIRGQRAPEVGPGE